MLDVLLKSLVFIAFIFAAGLGILSIKQTSLKWPDLFKRITPTKEANIKIIEKRILSPHQSLIEIEWRGASYLIHTNQSQSTLLDRITHKE